MPSENRSSLCGRLQSERARLSWKYVNSNGKRNENRYFNGYRYKRKADIDKRAKYGRLKIKTAAERKTQCTKPLAKKKKLVYSKSVGNSRPAKRKLHSSRRIFCESIYGTGNECS